MGQFVQQGIRILMITNRLLFIACISLASSLKAQSVDTSPVRTFKGHSGSVMSISFSPDGQYLVSGSKDKTAKLWDVATGQIIRTIQGQDKWVNSVSVSPDSRYLLTGSTDKTATLWDLSDGQPVHVFQGHRQLVNSVTFSPDGRYLATGSADKTVILWEIATNQKIHTYKGHRGSISSVSFSPSGRYLATGSADKTAILWETATGRKVRTFKVYFSDVNSVSFSPDGRYLAIGSDDNRIMLWNVDTGRKVLKFKGKSWVNTVAFSPDGRYLAAGFYKTARLWDVDAGKLVRIFRGHVGSVYALAFSPDSRYLATGDSKTVKLWEVAGTVFPLLAETNVEPETTLSKEASSIPTIAILDFEGIGIPSGEAITLSNRVGTHLVQQGYHKVIERGQMKDILQEQNFQMTGCTTDECAVQIGQLLGAQQILAGSIGKFGSVYTLDLKIIDVETGQVLWTTSYDSEGSINRLLTEGVAEVVRRIARME